ncbi:MAG: hypothetical protein Kow0077_00410 [Anaerolineae bacterium]
MQSHTATVPQGEILESQRTPDFWVIDRNLPRWARRSNPVVRRHLGGFLAVPIPETGLMVRLIAAQLLIIVLSFAIPTTLEFVALVGLVSLLAIPFSLGAYAGALFAIGRAATDFMFMERASRTLDTLRTTPLTTRTILQAKIAAAIWKQALNLDTVILSAAVFSLPIITIQWATLYDPSKMPIPARVGIMAGLVATMLRLVLEPLMVGALGVLVGSVTNLRFVGAMWTGLLTAAYFVLINLPRLGIIPWHNRLIIESILPVVLPPLITLAALRLTITLLHRE